MNLSTLQRMAREGDMSKEAMGYLLSCRGECAWLDYKGGLRLDNEGALCEFAKDALAIKNVGGGYIVVGVEDRTWRPVGLGRELPYDTKMVRDKIRHATGVELDVQIVHHIMDGGGRPAPFAIVLIRSSRKTSKLRAPTMVRKDFCAKQPFGLRRGEIYVRRGDSTVKVSSEEELEQLLDDLQEQLSREILEGGEAASPFAIENGTYRLLEKGYGSFIGRERLRDQILCAITRDPRLWVINVHGPGGVGKSALVNWAVHEIYERRTYEGIIQLTAKDKTLTPAGIVVHGRSLYSLENLLDHILIAFEEKPPAALESKRRLAEEILTAWEVLLVLDNMETVEDGRILSFVQSLPPESRAKVLMTSRTRTGGWELPVPVEELDEKEVLDFIRVRTRELEVDFPCNENVARRMREMTGGLPLAIQWVLGRSRLEGGVEKALSDVGRSDSPVLEFSFRNVWKTLSPDARAALAVMTIFSELPTLQDLTVATGFSVEILDKALAELVDVTCGRSCQVTPL